MGSKLLLDSLCYANHKNTLLTHLLIGDPQRANSRHRNQQTNENEKLFKKEVGPLLFEILDLTRISILG